MIKIQVFILPGCSRCSTGLAGLKEAADAFGRGAFFWEERNLLESIDDAVKLGILSSPAIVIGDKLAFSGALPSPGKLRAELSKYVNA